MYAAKPVRYRQPVVVVQNDMVPEGRFNPLNPFCQSFPCRFRLSQMQALKAISKQIVYDVRLAFEEVGLGYRNDVHVIMNLVCHFIECGIPVLPHGFPAEPF